MRVINDKFEIIFDLLKLKDGEDVKKFGNFILNIKNVFFLDNKYDEDRKKDFNSELVNITNEIIEEYNNKEITKEMIYNLQLKLINEIQLFIDEKQEEFNNDSKRI